MYYIASLDELSKMQYFLKFHSLNNRHINSIRSQTYWDVLNAVSRPNMFVNELNLYVDYLKNEISKNIASWTIRQEKQYNTFKENLIKGISYYKSILTEMKSEKNLMIERMKSELEQAELKLKNIYFPELV